MKISATIIADSINEFGVRGTTLELHYHRYILPEFNTHRAFARNGASSRAIPTAKLIEAALSERVEPLEWGLNQSGMQAFTIADAELELEGRSIWNEARNDAIRHAMRLNEKGFAKQIVNRVLEPFLSTRTVVTSTDWANFMALRDHKDAQPEIRELARQIVSVMEASTPRLLDLDEWHIPYILPEDEARIAQFREEGGMDVINSIRRLINPLETSWFRVSDDLLLLKLAISAARCARVSYRTVEGKPTDFHADLVLFERLVKSQPVHASPTEHQLTPWPVPKDRLTRNFTHYAPFRAVIKGETVHD